MTATNPAFWWCRFLVLVFWFSPRKFGVSPEKVGVIAFFRCSEFHCTKFTFIWLLELKWYWSKVRVFWNAVGILMVGLKKLCCIRKRVLGETLLKSCKCSLIIRKPIFLESVCFHLDMFHVTCFKLDMFHVTKFRLVRSICNVHLVTCINKYLINLFRISFFVKF